MTRLMPENDEPKCLCPSCGEECTPSGVCDCPSCERSGCDFCMPLEKDCQCPECEDEESA